MDKTLSVAFLWHMHQPLYKDFLSGKYYLPWVRLHATYSYLDMASIMEEFPDIRCTFNLTPSLIYQLLDISKGGGEDDLYLELSHKKASDLTEDEKHFILRNFFSCNPATSIFPIEKYRLLYARRGDKVADRDIKEHAKDFTSQDMRDLQVFFNLAWCGYTLKEKDDLVSGLLEKGKDYTEEEKDALLKRQKEVVSSILPLYRKLQDQGKIEISTTPFHHPILPLLCRGRWGHKNDLKKDAGWHVKEAVKLYEDVFGRKPEGMWPAEGGVSQDIIPVLSREGIKWMATDEEIVHNSFQGKKERDDLVFSAFKASNWLSSISVVFRDTNLSNAISFRYAHMRPEEAAKDLFRNIVGIKNAVAERKGDHLVSIILDGENPWPYYPDGGKGFLSGIYRLLSDAKAQGIETSSIGGYIKSGRSRKKIGRLASGSWINGNFRKWIGSPQKDKAWRYLKKTRDYVAQWGDLDPRVMEELYIAEGSDWFWWYDEFGTELNFVFDELFRMHLANVYKLMNKATPAYLDEPIYDKDRPGEGTGEMAS